MMENFSASITKAEQMTGGNVNILKTFETPTKTKPTLNSSTSLNASEKKSISSSIATSNPTTPTKKSVSSTGSYNSSVKVQNTPTPESSRVNDKRFTCTMCPFSTDRMNLLMMHIKGHSLEIQSRVSGEFSLNFIILFIS